MIGEIFREFGDEYIKNFKEHIPAEHIKAIRAIQQCKTEECGIHLYQCQKCGEKHIIYGSCGNRNCPVCQNRKNEQWLDKRLQRQLPGSYFMVTFTIPEEARDFMRKYQQVTYSLFFKAAAETLKTLISDAKYIGGDLPGFFGILHTWGRMLQYHPHIHFIVPGGALCRESGEWRRAAKGFLVPVHALSKVFKGKLKAELEKAGIAEEINPVVWSKNWNVNSQYIAGGSAGAMKYLAPYVFKPGISNARIISIQNRKVTFTYKKQRSSRTRRLTLDVMEFIRRFLQHVLPKGFMKVRYYGFMSGGCRLQHEELVAKVIKAYDDNVKMPEYKPLTELPPIKCPKCNGLLELIMIENHGVIIHFQQLRPG